MQFRHLLILLLFPIWVQVQAQTTPTTPPPANPQQMTTNTVYQDAVTKKYYVYNGSTFLWRQLTDSLQVKRMIASFGGGTVTSITPGIGFTSHTPITSSGTLNVDTTALINQVFSTDRVMNGDLSMGKKSISFSNTGSSMTISSNVNENVITANSGQLTLKGSAGGKTHQIVIAPNDNSGSIVFQNIGLNNNKPLILQDSLATMLHAKVTFAPVDSDDVVRLKELKQDSIYNSNKYLNNNLSRQWYVNAWIYNLQTPYHASEGILERRGLSDTIIQVMHIDSSGNHVSDNGRLVVRRSLDKGKTWGSITTIADSLNVDDRNAAGGNINTNFIVFYRQYKKATSTQIGTGYRVSSDGLTYGPYIQLATGTAAGIPFGRPVKLHDGSYIQTFYSVTGGTNTGFLRRSTDNGLTWGSPVTIFSTPTSTKNYTELCVARVNNSPTAADSLICIVRDDGPSNSRDSSYLQYVSVGDYTSWTFKGRTNLGDYSFDVTPSIGYDADEKKVFVLATNRIKGNTLQYPAGYTNKIYLYVNNVSEVFNNPTAWTKKGYISRPWPSNITIYGQPLFAKVDTNRYLVVFTDRDTRGYPGPRGDDYEIANIFQTNITIGNSKFTIDSLNSGILKLNTITNRYETGNTDTAFFRNKQTNTIQNIGKNGLFITSSGVASNSYGLAIADSTGTANFAVRDDGSTYLKPPSTTSTSGSYQLVTQNTSTGFLEKLPQPNFITTDGNNITNMATVTSQDLNTVTGTRVFAAVSPTNGPSGAGNGALMQYARTSNIITQVYYPVSLTAISPYIRNTQTGSAGWGNWVQVTIQDAVNTATDANHTISSAAQLVKLPLITANRTVTLPSASTYVGRFIRIWNQNTSGTFLWTFASTVKDATSTTITAIANTAFTILESDGTNWVKIN